MIFSQTHVKLGSGPFEGAWGDGNTKTGTNLPCLKKSKMAKSEVSKERE